MRGVGRVYYIAQRYIIDNTARLLYADIREDWDGYGIMILKTQRLQR